MAHGHHKNFCTHPNLHKQPNHNHKYAQVIQTSGRIRFECQQSKCKAKHY